MSPQFAPGNKNFKVVEPAFPKVVIQEPNPSNLFVVYRVDCTLGLSITILAERFKELKLGEMVNFLPAILLKVML